MADYIDRKALLDRICGNIRVTHRPGEPSLEIRGANKVINFIEEAPAVDVVEVVRCKDCKYMIEKGWCCLFDARMNRYDFCSCGERREE